VCEYSYSKQFHKRPFVSERNRLHTAGQRNVTHVAHTRAWPEKISRTRSALAPRLSPIKHDQPVGDRPALFLPRSLSFSTKFPLLVYVSDCTAALLSQVEHVTTGPPWPPSKGGYDTMYGAGRDTVNWIRRWPWLRSEPDWLLADAGTGDDGAPRRAAPSAAPLVSAMWKPPREPAQSLATVVYRYIFASNVLPCRWSRPQSRSIGNVAIMIASK